MEVQDEGVGLGVSVVVQGGGGVDRGGGEVPTDQLAHLQIRKVLHQCYQKKTTCPLFRGSTAEVRGQLTLQIHPVLVFLC